MTIKILHIIQSLEVGGMENGVVNITNSIGDEFPSVIYCTKARGALADKLIDKNSVHFEECKESLFWITFKLLKYCLLNRPAILHTHSWGTLISGFIVSKILRIKLIHGEHGTVYFDSKKDIAVQKYMLSRTDKNLFVSESLRVLFKQKINLTHKVRVIHNGVDSSRFRKRSLEVSEFFPEFSNKIIIGTVARLLPVKNQLWLIKALSKTLGKDVKLVIVGSGKLQNDLEEIIAKENLKDDVVLYGESKNPENLMNCFDVFVLPSLSEGLSNTILEAMSCGLPVVASNVGGNSELIEDGSSGCLFKLNDCSEFNLCINQFIESADFRKKFGDISRKRVDEMFSLRVMMRNYQSVYKEVVR